MENKCQRCGVDLHGPDPLKRRAPPRNGRRYSVDHQPSAPVKVSKPNAAMGEPGEPVVFVSWWCSSRCFKQAHAKPSKPAGKGKKGRKPARHQHLILKPERAA